MEYIILAITFGLMVGFYAELKIVEERIEKIEKRVGLRR
jgi:uncharacterized protein YneF (UPF0154 family)